MSTKRRLTGVRRLSPIELIGHWLLTVSLVVLFLTHGGLIFPSFQVTLRLFGNARRAAFIHRRAGIFFSIGLVFTFWAWLREYGPYQTAANWLNGVKTYPAHHEASQGRGKFTTAQKIHFLGVMLFGLLSSSSGLILWNSHLYQREMIAWCYALHAFSAAFFAASGIIHIYLRHAVKPSSHTFGKHPTIHEPVRETYRNWEKRR
ncbi:MAG: cytochrome b/b6 domain-containing protein [bacterium]